MTGVKQNPPQPMSGADQVSVQIARLMCWGFTPSPSVCQDVYMCPTILPWCNLPAIFRRVVVPQGLQRRGRG